MTVWWEFQFMICVILKLFIHEKRGFVVTKCTQNRTYQCNITNTRIIETEWIAKGWPSQYLYIISTHQTLVMISRYTWSEIDRIDIKAKYRTDRERKGEREREWVSGENERQPKFRVKCINNIIIFYSHRGLEGLESYSRPCKPASTFLGMSVANRREKLGWRCHMALSLKYRAV